MYLEIIFSAFHPSILVVATGLLWLYVNAHLKTPLKEIHVD